MAKQRKEEDAREYWTSYYGEDFDEPICNNCVHRDSGSITCKAYPNRIPNEIISNQVDHTKPYIGDNGIVFEEKKKV